MAWGSTNAPGASGPKLEEVAALAQSALDKANEAIENSGPSGCVIKITFDAGFVGQPYTVTDGNGDTKTGTVPESRVDSVSVQNCNTVYTIKSTADGIEYTNTITTGQYYGQYSATLTVFTGYIKVTAVAGAKVEATLGGIIYEATAASNGIATITTKKAGNYAISATYDGVNSSSTTANVTTSGATVSVTVSFITLTVNVDNGSTVKAVNGSTTKTATVSSGGSVKFFLPNTGTWNITATLNGQTATGSASCTAYQNYTVALSYVKVFGVQWAKGTSTALTRLTKANDPNGHVNTDITSNPSPAVGTGAGSSPFDNYAPWKDMDEYNIVNNAVGARKGASGFSRTANDTMVYIPEFYYKVVDASGKRNYYIADKPKSGFAKHPGSGKYVGRYNTISGYYSKSGAAPLVNITRAAARTGSRGKGSKWSQYDFATWNAVWLLYLVEFADWNSQAKIGRGYVDGNSAAIASGGTDSMNYHTGRAAGTDGKTAVQYRHIENPWGNVYEWIDGVNFNNRKAYVCTNPANYADDTTSNYTDTGITLAESGWIKDLGLSNNADWAFLPTAVGGSETTYVPDYLRSGTGWRVLYVGGLWDYASSAGLLYFGAHNYSSGSSSGIGARLLYHP